VTSAGSEREIHLAGGCFWGIQKLLDQVHGVVETEAGYANGPGPAPTYEQVCADSGHAETVRVVYDPGEVDLTFILEQFLDAIDPVAVNRQGDDVGVQYRSGIYWTDPRDRLPIDLSLAAVQRHHERPLAVEVAPLEVFHRAEEYHQHYFDTHPDAVCHIPAAVLARAAAAVPQERFLRENAGLRRLLTPVQYEVTVHGRTEVEGSGELTEETRPGIYVDVAGGRPLFSSADKFDAGCGWPSFTRPLDEAAVNEAWDTSRNRRRREVRSAVSDLHLGHVFEDGPAEAGGRRYCINAAALRFVPLENMAEEGYGDFVALVSRDEAGAEREAERAPAQAPAERGALR